MTQDMDKKVVAIIQARWNSSRLKGKISKLIENKSVLEHVLERVKKTNGVHEVCCSIPNDYNITKIKKLVSSKDIKFFYGDENDVLRRFYETAKFMNADIIMRVTSDCPLTNPSLNNQVLNLLINNKLDYASNNLPPSFPHGLDCEVFTFDILKKCNAKATKPFDREHVTPWIKRNKNVKKLNLFCKTKNVKHFRLTIDYIEDLYLLRKVFKNLEPNMKVAEIRDLLKFIKKNPKLFLINKKHIIER